MAAMHGLDFQASCGDSEPPSRPVLILGGQSNLQSPAVWSQVKGKLEPHVSKEVMNTGQ